MIRPASQESRFALAAAGLLGSYAALIALAPRAEVSLALALPPLAIAGLWWTLQTPARWLAAFFYCALLLPPLPIALGDSGPHICLAFAATGLLAGALRMADWRIRRGFLPAAMLLFFAALLASVSLAALYSGPSIAIGSMARVLLFGISVYIFFYTAYGPAARFDFDTFHAARVMFWIAAASAAFACLDFYFQFPAPAGYGPQFVWLDSGIFRRAQGVFYEASTLGNFCAFFIVMIAVALFYPRRLSPLSRKAMLAGGALLATALVFSYSRASLANVVAATATLLWLNRSRFKLGRIAAITLLAPAAVALIVYTAFPSFAANYWTRRIVSWQYLFSATNGILSGRLETWRFLGEFLWDHPWHAILGIGYKTLPYTDFAGRPAVADNMYLSLLLETGILGLAAFAAFNVAVLIASWRAAHAADSRRAFFGQWMFCFWMGQMFQMLSGDLFTYWRVLPVYFWVLAIAIRL